jgi:outer membrane lipoprotein SlyB
MKHLSLSILAALSLLAAGCAKNLDPNTYTEASAGQISETYQGVILSTRDVVVKGGDKLTDNGMGIILGGAAGGLGGNLIGQGKGNVIATVGGVVVGAAIGALGQSALSEQPALEYVVKYWDIETGSVRSTTTENDYKDYKGSETRSTAVNSASERLITMVQGVNPRLNPGQRVFIQVAANGRSRLIPDQSMEPQLNQDTIEAVKTGTKKAVGKKAKN